MSSRQLSVIPHGTNQGPFYGNIYGDVPSQKLSHLPYSQEFKPANKFLWPCFSLKSIADVDQSLHPLLTHVRLGRRNANEWRIASRTLCAIHPELVQTLSICGANPASISQCWRTTLHCTPLSDVPTPRAGESDEYLREMATELFSITDVRNRILDTRLFVRDTKCISGGQHRTTWKVPLGTWVSGGHQVTIGGGSIRAGPSSCQGYQLELKTELLETFPRWGVQTRAVPRVKRRYRRNLPNSRKHAVGEPQNSRCELLRDCWVLTCTESQSEQFFMR